LPLFGKRVLVTRAAGQVGGLSRALAEQGAEVVPVPAIRVVPPEDFGPLDEALAHLSEFHWVVLTSANGVEAFFARLKTHHRDARALAGIRVAVVGAETAKALSAHGVEADLVPTDSHAEGLAEAMIEAATGHQKVLLAQAAGARRVLPELLTREGIAVTVAPAYRTVAPEVAEVDLAALETAPLDYATFTSSSTVRNLEGLLGTERFRAVLAGARIAAIGPVTAQTVREAGLTVHVQPEGPSTAHLVAALCADAAQPADTRNAPNAPKEGPS